MGSEVNINPEQLPLAVAFAQMNASEDAVSGSASIPTSAWTTVLSYTPTEAKVLTSFNADVGAILAQTFRVRLRVGTIVKISEALSSTNMGVINCAIRVPAGVAVDVQVFHAEATAQTYEASIQHRKAA